MRQQLKLLSIFFGLVTFSVCFATGQKTITIGLEAVNNPPFYYHLGNKILGSNIRVIDSIFRKMHYQVKWKVLPIDKVTEAMLSGKIDFKYPDSPDWNTELKADHAVTYSKVVQPNTDGVFVKPENIGKPLAFFKLIGTPNEFTVAALKKQIKAKQIKIKQFNIKPDLIEAVLQNKIQGSYMSETGGKYYLRHVLGDSNALVFDDKIPYAINDFLLSTTTQQKLLKRFNRGLKGNPLLVEL